MADYRRANFEGGYYFFTVVTYERRPFLTGPLARQYLHAAWEEARQRRDFEMVAVCLLPEHLHCIWRLPQDDCHFSLPWACIKSGFTRRYLAAGGTEHRQSPSRTGRRERGIWQRRFWEHQIRDEADLQHHVDYIHYDPAKHGLVARVEDWPWSSYHRYARTCAYTDGYWQTAQDQFKGLVIIE